MVNDTRILHVVTRSDWGGAQRIVRLLAAGTEADVTVACGAGGQLIPKLREDGISVYEIPSLQSRPSPSDDIRVVWKLWRLLQRESFDLVHCHSTKAGFLGRIAAKLTGTPTIFTVHGWGFYNSDYNRLTPILVRGEHQLASITDTIVCVSQNDFDVGQHRGILQKTDATVIHNGIPPISISDNRKSLHDELGIKNTAPIIGAIARLSPQKNPLSILQTAEQLQRRNYDVVTVLIGDGPLMDKCEKYVAKHGIENVYLLGFKQQALELLPDFEVFLLPSRFEGLPLTVLEAMHVGVPIVAYDVGGVSEAVLDRETGYIVEQGNHETFVSKVASLLDNSECRAEMGEAAANRAVSKFTAGRMVADYEQLYRRILSID